VIIEETPKTFVLRKDGLSFLEKKRMYKNARKKFACPTKEEAFITIIRNLS
jgi:hypothetical protein